MAALSWRSEEKCVVKRCRDTDEPRSMPRECATILEGVVMVIDTLRRGLEKMERRFGLSNSCKNLEGLNQAWDFSALARPLKLRWTTERLWRCEVEMLTGCWW